MNAVIDLLQSHRSIRKFTDEPVSEELFRELMRAGQSAATSSHVQATSVIRVSDPGKRERIAELAGGQDYVASCAEFLVFCADMKRLFDTCERNDVTGVHQGMTEQFIIATVDTALFAQNVAVAAESAGLGICYIGGIRNNPQEISDILNIPENVYPVFGFCMGHPAQNPEIKPRLPLDVIVKDDGYTDTGDAEAIARFDESMARYYRERNANAKNATWSEQIGVLFTRKARPHMRGFLQQRGFGME